MTKTYSVEDADDGVLADIGGADDGSCAGCGTVADAVGGNVKLNLFFFMAPKKKNHDFLFN